MNERLRILDLIESGEISVEEGLGLLEALGGAEGEVSETPPETPAEPAAPAVRPTWVRVAWQVVLWVGVALLGGGGFLLVSFYAREGASSGLTWGWVVFALGVLVVGLAWWLQRARWFYLRVNEQERAQLRYRAADAVGAHRLAAAHRQAFRPAAAGDGSGRADPGHAGGTARRSSLRR